MVNYQRNKTKSTIVVRRRYTDGETVTDMLHVNARLGSVVQEAEPDVSGDHVGTTNGYVTNADGEPFWVDDLQPTDENHIQYHGGFLEDSAFHTATEEPDQERGYFYRMGVRHYSPMLGRFLQRDPLTQSRPGMKSSPLSMNPYIYAHNKPTQMSDTSGYSPSPQDVSATLCPGCMNSAGYGMGESDSGGIAGPFFHNTGGNGDIPTDNEKPYCDRWMPRRCLEEGQDPDLCAEKCCHMSDDPEWKTSCCGITVDIMPCMYTNEGDCACGCCGSAGRGGQYAPNTQECFGGYG